LSQQSNDRLSRLALHILAVLCSGPLHGYGIRREIEDLTEKKLSPSMASMYESLLKLLDAGLIERAGEKVIGGEKIRKLYRITGAGAKVLDAELAELDRVRARASARLAWTSQGGA
jgi:DNA-binding PadR family transcriptional regulator